jgi:hypothetical protein
MGMFNKTCKETSVLVTQSMDRRLSWGERLGMRIHLSVCDNCARFMKQMRLIQEWLSDEGRERIARKLPEGE